jgi:hypothetical protein
MLLAACGVGGDDGPDPVDPNPLAIACTDAFTVTGTFTPSTARPVDNPATPNIDESVAGCWPAGMWTFTAALDPTDDNILDVSGDKIPDRCGRVAGTQAATFEAGYAFTVTRTDDGDGYVDAYAMNSSGLAADCSAAGAKCVFRLKVSEGGSRECEGGLEIFSADRKQYWNLHPEQATGSTSISGVGEFTQYNAPQNP